MFAKLSYQQKKPFHHKLKESTMQSFSAVIAFLLASVAFLTIPMDFSDICSRFLCDCILHSIAGAVVVGNVKSGTTIRIGQVTPSGSVK